MKLTAEEREVVLTWSDADRRWHVYCDSLVLRGAVLEIAQRVGVTPESVGNHGIEFDLPAGRGISLPAIQTSPPSVKAIPVAGLRTA